MKRKSEKSEGGGQETGGTVRGKGEGREDSEREGKKRRGRNSEACVQ